MTRGVATIALMVLLAVMPVVRSACDVACLLPTAPAAVPSHCASHDAAPDSPAAPADQCRHDHHGVQFLTSIPAAPMPPSAVAFALPFVFTFADHACAPVRISPVARGGPPSPSGPIVLRI